jgi:hypothetical protein
VHYEYSSRAGDLSPMRPAKHDKHTVRAKIAAEPKVPVPVALFSPVLARDVAIHSSEGTLNSARSTVSMKDVSDDGDADDEVSNSLSNRSIETDNSADSSMSSPHVEPSITPDAVRMDSSRPCTPVTNTHNQYKNSVFSAHSHAASSYHSTPASPGYAYETVISSQCTISISPIIASGDDENEENNENLGPQTATTSEEEDSDEEEEEDDIFNPYNFIVNLPPHETIYDKDKICLPAKHESSAHRFKHTLVLDLDETLVHCTVDPVDNPDMVFPVNCNGNCYQVYVRKRPYLEYFLQTVSQLFEVVVFTASQRIYANVLLDKLDPHNRLIHHRLFREACVLVQGNYLKDLTVLGRDLSKVRRNFLSLRYL